MSLSLAPGVGWGGGDEGVSFQRPFFYLTPQSSAGCAWWRQSQRRRQQAASARRLAGVKRPGIAKPGEEGPWRASALGVITGRPSGHCRPHHVGPGASSSVLVPPGAAVAAAPGATPSRPNAATHPVFPCGHLPQRHEPQPLGGCPEHLQA